MTGKAAQPYAPPRRRQRKGQPTSKTQGETQQQKQETQRKGKNSNSPRRGRKNEAEKRGRARNSPRGVTPHVAEQTGNPEEPQPLVQTETQPQNTVENTEKEVRPQDWDTVLESTLKDVSNGIHKYAVAVETPLSVRIRPQRISDDVKLCFDENGERSPDEDRVVEANVYYQMPVLQMVALASLVKNDVFMSPLKVIEGRRPKMLRLEESRFRNGDHPRYHDQLTPFEHQLDPAGVHLLNQPLQPMYPPNSAFIGVPPPENMMSFPIHVAKQGNFAKDRGPHRTLSEWKAVPSDASQRAVKRSQKSGPGAGSKWLMPTATDGIFSLGSIKETMAPGQQGPAASTNVKAANALKNISQMMQDMHMRGRGATGATDDVTSLSTKEASNFTFFDENMSTPLKSSQFSKFFSAKLESLDSATSKPGGDFGKHEDGDGALDDARNRQRATQLLQMMLARKT